MTAHLKQLGRRRLWIFLALLAGWVPTACNRDNEPAGEDPVGVLSLVGVLGLCAWDAHGQRENPDWEGLEILVAARALQAITSAPGAANTVHPVHDWGVLADERCAPLVAWYAGRPCATLGAQRNGDPEGAAALRAALQENSVQAFRSRLAAMGLRWCVFGPQSPARWVENGADGELMARFFGREQFARRGVPGGVDPELSEGVW